MAVGTAATVGLLALAFPPAEWRGLAWCALVPLLLVIDVRSGWRGVLVLWIGGMVFGTLGFVWVHHVTWLGTFLLGFYVSVYFLLFCVSVRWFAFGRGVPLVVAAPVIWAGLEFVRGVFLGGLPWLYLAHTQYRELPVVQVADLTGAPGVTFWLVTVNAALAETLRRACRRTDRPRVLRVVLSVALALVMTGAGLWYGVHRLRTILVKEGPRVAVVQGNIPQDVKNRATMQTFAEMFRTHVRLTRSALRSTPPPDLVIWPETMAPPGSLDRLGTRWRAPRVIGTLARFQQRTALVISANAAPEDPPNSIYNSAFLLPKGAWGPTRRYDKIHLVPFGEHVPLKPLIGWLVGPLIPYERGLTPGRRHEVFEVAGWRFAPTICFEDAFPELVAEFSRRGGGVDFLVNVTNEGWFKDGSELDHHLAIAVFRAVENRAGLVRAANTGISAFISPTGRIVSTLVVDGRDREVQGVLQGRALATDTRSPYRAVGETFGRLCALAWIAGVLGLGLSAVVRRRRSKRGPGDTSSRT